MQANQIKASMAYKCKNIGKQAAIGQMKMNQYYPHLTSVRTVINGLLEWIGSAWQFVQMTLLNLWSSRTLGPS